MLIIGGREFLRKASRSIFKLTRLGLKNGPHVTRYFMYRHLAALRIEPPGDARALSISGSHWLCRILGFSEGIENVHYPKVNILHLPFVDEEFDCVASDQVLEHVEGNPLLAVDECFRILKPGGIAVHTTCFINPIHSFPSDFWRFTPDALALLVQPHADVIDGGGWGNRWVWPYNALGLRFEPIPHARWHPFHWIATHNNPDWPIVTWVVAKKR